MNRIEAIVGRLMAQYAGSHPEFGANLRPNINASELYPVIFLDGNPRGNQRFNTGMQQLAIPNRLDGYGEKRRMGGTRSRHGNSRNPGSR